MEQKKAQGDKLAQLVTFIIGEEVYAVEILKVQEIIRLMDITRIPKAPDFVEGVINLRSRVIPVIDLRRRFKLAARPHDKDTRIIILEVYGVVVGFGVDSVSEVLRIPANTIDQAPPILAGHEQDYIKGVGKIQDRLLIFLDLENLFSLEEMELLGSI